MADILIADDSESIRQLLKDVLVMGKHTVVAEAIDGAEAVILYQQHKPQITLLDYNMPKKDGFTVLKEILVFDPNAKIIMITANDVGETTKQCVDSGAVTCITKPFEVQTILKTITQIL